MPQTTVTHPERTRSVTLPIALVVYAYPISNDLVWET